MGSPGYQALCRVPQRHFTMSWALLASPLTQFLRAHLLPQVRNPCFREGAIQNELSKGPGQAIFLASLFRASQPRKANLAVPVPSLTHAEQGLGKECLPVFLQGQG